MAKKIAKKPSRRDNRLTIYQIQFLEFMGIFVYITLSQAFRLGLGNNRGNFTKHVLARPKRMELLDWILPTETGYEYVYHLREKGAEQLVKLTNAKIEKIKYPTPKDYTWSGGYYLHSKYTIDCAIECYLRAKSLGIEILDYDIDLEKSYSKGEREDNRAFWE